MEGRNDEMLKHFAARCSKPVGPLNKLSDNSDGWQSDYDHLDNSINIHFNEFRTNRAQVNVPYNVSGSRRKHMANLYLQDSLDDRFRQRNF